MLASRPPHTPPIDARVSARLAVAVGAPARLAAVRATGLLDTPTEAAFDRFTALAHRLLGVPVCLLSLVDAERDFFKSAIGLPEPLATARQVPTGPGAPSFCQYMVSTGAPLAVEDARGHPVLGAFPAVRDGGAVACAGAPLLGPEGHVVGTLCVLDIVPRVWSDHDQAVLRALADAASTEIALRLEAARAYAALHAREAMLHQFVEHAPAAVALVDCELRYLVASGRWSVDHGLGTGSLIGQRHDALLPGLPAPWRAAYARVLAGEVCRGTEATFVRADGREEQARYELHPWRAADGAVAGILMYTELTTEQRRLERELAHQAVHDALTGLPNRVLFHDRVTRALAQRAQGRDAAAGAGEHLAVLLIDLDDFKTVNDTLGHAAGDRLVQGVAARLLGATRGVDTVARLGGDEFAVLLEGLAAPDEAEVVVTRILRALAAPVPLADAALENTAPATDGCPTPAPRRAILTSASLGVAHASAEDTVETLLRGADVAMYRAKAAGKGGYAVFDPAMEDAWRERLALEAELRQLLAEPGATHPAYGALALVFQPVVDLADGRPVSVEALVRWEHPRHGTLAPAAFIPLAEERGLIVPLGAWVLAEACRHLAQWEASLPPDAVPALAVNVSGRQLEDPEVVARVADVLRATGVRPDRVSLEITETALARDPDAARDVLTALKALGVRLAIDDFGTGYSSLSYLQQFPVDVLKIDKRFVDGVAGGGSEAALARTIVALGQTLGLRTVAEGVETRAQQDVLHALGCAQGQGYLFARPLAPDAAWRLLAGAAAGRIGAAPVAVPVAGNA